MNTSNLRDKFYNFELKNNLFDIQDKNGIFIWDIIRYWVYTSLLWDTNYLSNNKRSYICKIKLAIQHKTKNIINTTRSLWALFFSTKKTYFFFLSSRNRYNDSDLFFDLNAYSAINTFESKNIFILETYQCYRKKMIYEKHIKIQIKSPISRFFLNGYRKYNISPIWHLIKQEFPTFKLPMSFLDNEIKRFYCDRKFYRKLWKKQDVQKIFITQNGIQKGLFAAAKDLNIKVYEFQHGLVYNGHMAYSYPKVNGLDKKTYLPSAILSLSEFWFQDCFLPNVDIYPIGNDYFCPKVNNDNNRKNTDKSILVVSSDIMGDMLSNFIIKLINENEKFYSSYFFIFKLHPNQYSECTKYKSIFSKYSNVKVYTNEKTVQEFLSECNTMLTIQSTAVYEALQCCKKVVILKELTYMIHEHIFNLNNVYVISSESEFFYSLNQPIKKNDVPFFEPFKKDIYLKAIQ